MITLRSLSISVVLRIGRTMSSPRTSIARGASRIGTRTQYTVDSRSVAALNEPPTPSIASLMSRVDGYAAVPLNVMCSMKWATPASAALSRREPARTYAAMETERAPGTRELMTRGPSTSAVRSNIRAMVQEEPRATVRPTGLVAPGRDGRPPTRLSCPVAVRDPSRSSPVACPRRRIQE